MKTLHRALLGLAFIAVFWYLLALIYPLYVPSPIKVAETFLSSESAKLLRPTLVTVKVVLLCLAAGLVAGYAVGCAMGLSERAKAILYFPASVLKSVPVSVFLPVFISIFHLDLYIYPMLCFPIAAMVAVNIANSILAIPQERQMQRQLLKLSLWSYLRDVVFWETLESLFATIRIAAPFCLTLQIALDYFLAANGGLGALIREQNDVFSFRLMFAAILLVCVFGYSMLLIIDGLSKRLLIWKTKRLN